MTDTKSPIASCDGTRFPGGVRLVDVLLLVYVIAVLYGSLMPFDMRADCGAVSARLHRAARFWPFGPVPVSGRDVASNVLLYSPLGFLIAGRFGLRHGRRSVLTLAALAACLAFASTVEATQLLSVSRTASLADLVANTLGGTLGGAVAAAVGPLVWRRRANWLSSRVTRGPAAFAALAVVLLLAADALDPMYPVMRLSELARNLRGSHFRLEDGLLVHPWHHWLVCRIGVYAALAVLLGSATGRRRWRWGRAAGLAVLFAAASETCKPFVAARVANAANVVTAACGAALGAGVGAVSSGRLPLRRKAVVAAVAVATYLAYHEWKPLVFAWDIHAMAAKLPLPLDWLPLRGFALGSRNTGEIRLFVRVTALTAAMVWCTAAWRGWTATCSTRGLVVRALAVATGLGLLLEAGQFPVIGRHPSPSHILFFLVGGSLGAWLSMARCVQAMLPQMAERSTTKTHHDGGTARAISPL